MKKTVWRVIVQGLTLLLAGVGVAGAYTIEDNVISLGRYSQGGLYETVSVDSDVPRWRDVIGDPDTFDVRGINVSQVGTKLNFELYANMGWNCSYNEYNYYLADLAIGTPGGVFRYGVVLHESFWDTPVDSSRTENLSSTDPPLSVGLYQVNNWLTSSNLYLVSNTGAMTDDLTVYGGQYYDEGQLEPLVAIESGDLLQALIVTPTVLSDGADALYRYSFSFERSLLAGVGYEIELFWGGASCGNDAIAGSAVVPEPGTLTLFGAGLVGLALMRKKTKKH